MHGKSLVYKIVNRFLNIYYIALELDYPFLKILHKKYVSKPYLFLQTKVCEFSVCKVCNCYYCISILLCIVLQYLENSLQNITNKNDKYI